MPRHTPRRVLLFSSILLSCALLTGGAQQDAQPRKVLATFQLNELFGVGWPDQPIEFRYDGGRPPLSDARMIGPDGREVAYQWVSSCSDATATKGCIAVRGDLPERAHSRWTLEAGVRPSVQPEHPVKVEQTNTLYEVTNGLAGVRILASGGNPKPWNRAPIQGVLLPDGKWTGVGSGPNLLYSESASNAGAAGAPLRTPMYTVTGYQVSVVDAGPLKTVLRATYTFQRPRYFYGKTVINQAGAGHYTITATLYAGSKSVIIDEDSDMQFSYLLPLYAQLQPDLARYRGHHAEDSICGYEAAVAVTDASNGSPILVKANYSLSNGQKVLITDVKGNAKANGSYYAKTAGYPNGQFGLYEDPNLSKPVAGTGAYTGGGIAKPVYRGVNANPLSDSFLDITYGPDREPSYLCGPNTYRKLLTNYSPAAPNAGWYVMAYKANAGPMAPVVGFFVGRSSQQHYVALGPSQPGLYSSARHWMSGTRDAGIQVDNLLRAPDGRVTDRVHRNWAIWVSRQSDILATNLHQPIQDDFNALAGINLSHIYAYQLSYPDPPGGWKWLYLSQRSGEALAAAIKNGTGVCGSPDCFSKLMWDSESSNAGRALNAMWKAGSTAANQKALDGAAGLATRVSWNLAHGGNHFDRPGYYELGLNSLPQTAVLNAILVDSNSTPAQKATAKAALAFFGCLFWDNDWFPVDNVTGEGGGLSNQVEQYLMYRAQSVAAAPTQPFLATKLDQALRYVKDDFEQNFSSTGAGAGSTHYQSAFFEPLILNFMAFAQRGLISMNDPKWVAYSNWELSTLTPPEPRFGNVRKGYSNGDGNTESDVRTGMLATALYQANPTIAGNLMWAWQQSNSAAMVTEDQQFTTTLATIDATIPRIPPSLGSINVPGYHTAERHGFGTPYETALWFIDGGFYSAGGHRHYDDGQVSIYAHSAPLAIDWNANLYSPHTEGRFAHDSIVFDNELKHAWYADNPSLDDASSLLANATNTEFCAFRNSTASAATFTSPDGTVWTRTVRMMAFDAKYPIVYVHDAFSGAGVTAGKTLTWNMMASGAVATPAGTITPAARFSTGCQGVPGQLPSSGPIKSLAPGLERFTFTGIRWPQHATGGIDWDVFISPGSPSAQFTLGNWGHGCHASREMGEFQKANGAPFSETQHILRVHDTGPFTTIILPYRKTEAPSRAVSRQPCGTQIAQGSATTCFNGSSATYTDGAINVLTVYDDSSQTAFGATLSGGTQEIVIQGSEAKWVISGARSGVRTLALPGDWRITDRGVSRANGVFTYNYAGGLQAAPVTIALTRAQ